MSESKIYARTLVKDTKYISNDQYTVPQLPSGGYNGLLTEKGQQLLKECLEQVRENKFKNTFTDWRWDHVLSGAWFEPNDLIDPIIGARGFLNARNNRVIIGMFTGNDEEMQTSPVRFCGDGWCQTISGSLYAIPADTKRPGKEEGPLLINFVW